MDNIEYLKALESPNIINRRKALDSGYIPKNAKEVNATIEAVILGGNSDLQIKAYTLLDTKVPSEVAKSGFICLALKSNQKNIRIDSINKVRSEDSEDVTNALLLASYDNEIDVQKIAISALEGRDSSEITELLLTRIKNPEFEILPNYKNKSDEIKSAAINSLGIRDKNDQIRYLVEIAIKDSKFRPEVKASLIRIGTTEVAEILLSIIEGQYIPDEKEKQINLDREIRLFIANVIPSVKTTEVQLKKYRLFLCSLYKEEIVKGVTELSKYVKSYFNEEIGKCLSEIIENHGAQLNVVDRVISDLSSVLISLSFPYWLNILDNPGEQIYQKAVNKLIEILSIDFLNFPSLLSNSIKLGDRTAHQKNRMVQIVTNLSKGNVKPFADHLVPQVCDTEISSSTLALRYLQAIWQQVSLEEKEIMLESIFKKGLSLRKDGQVSLEKFFIDTWDIGSEESHGRIYHQLIVWHNKLTSKDSKNALDNLVLQLAKNISQPGSFAQFVISDLEGMSRNDNQVDYFVNILKNIPLEETGKLLLGSINLQWNKSLLEIAINLNVPGIESFCRSTLSNDNSGIPAEDKAWIIEILGEYKNIGDAALFTKFITSGNTIDIQVKAIQSLSRLPFSNEIESSLLRSLKTPSVQVVKEAIISLGKTATPTVQVISALQERSNPSEEDEDSIRKLAQDSLEKIKQRHLQEVISKESEDINFENWLKVLQHIGLCDCALILENLLKQHADPEYAKRRILIISSISRCTKPDDGIEILNEYVVNERVANVKDAMKAALDEMEGHPDRADLKLVENVVGHNIDRNDLLGNLHLSDVFFNQRTLVALRDGLRRAINLYKDNDSLIEQLDSISDALIRDLFEADVQNLDPNNKIPQDAHDSRIGKLKSTYPDIALPANVIHELRKLKAKGPHSFDPSGAIRSGVDDNDRKHAIESFYLLFKEIIQKLRQLKESR